MSNIKLAKTDKGWVVSLLKRRGKTKVLPVSSVPITLTTPDAILNAIDVLEAEQKAIADARRS